MCTCTQLIIDPYIIGLETLGISPSVYQGLQTSGVAIFQIILVQYLGTPGFPIISQNVVSHFHCWLLSEGKLFHTDEPPWLSGCQP